MATKLLLTEDVETLGRKGDVVSVRAGYARNFLLPQKLALIANANTLRSKKRLEEERAKQALVDRQESESLAQSLEGKMVTTFVKVDHEGHMYGSVSTADIIHLIQEQLNATLEKRAIHLKHPLKTLGTHKVEIKLKEGVTALVQVRIAAEGTTPEEETQAEETAPESEG
ncbi:MAG TPA: 50S ribosomal protein L9 [Parachlamydiaceae bacterium]|nr:50S ribosomal protein L9 [Parachlamydiaceae bacterium]